MVLCVQCFTESDFATFLRDDQQLLRAAHARWMLLCEREPTCDTVDADSNSEAKGVYLSSSPSMLGSSADSDLLLADAAAAAQHARAWRDEHGDCYLEVGLGCWAGTWDCSYSSGRFAAGGCFHTFGQAVLTSSPLSYSSGSLLQQGMIGHAVQAPPRRLS
jgi:hypothetical protein